MTLFSDRLPNIDSFSIYLENNWITFGVTKFNVQIIEGDYKYIQVSMRPKLKDLVGLNHKYSMEDIEYSGLSKKINKSQIIKEKILIRTFRLMRALGIHHDEVTKFVNSCIKNTNMDI